jgi:broad specificity phosphatase PhoE
MWQLLVQSIVRIMESSSAVRRLSTRVHRPLNITRRDHEIAKPPCKIIVQYNPAGRDKVIFNICPASEQYLYARVIEVLGTDVHRKALSREACIMVYSRRAVLSTIIALLFVVPTYAQPRPSDAELAQMLRAGGNVIVFRHGATHADQADTDPLNPENVAKQRQLNAKGEEAAKALGEAFKSIGVPVGKAIASQFNRAYQTAKLAGFDHVEKNVDITEGGLVVSPNENNRRVAAFRKLASTPPPAGTNIVIVTHKPNIIDAFGKDWFEVKEGEATIFKPDGTAYTVVARVQMDEWPRIAAAAMK